MTSLFFGSEGQFYCYYDDNECDQSLGDKYEQGDCLRRPINAIYFR